MKFGPLRWPDASAAEHAIEWEPREKVLNAVTCGHCEETVGMKEGGYILPTFGDRQFTPYHEPCFIRTIVGSVSHQQRTCSCFGGVLTDEPKGMTRRQSARASVMYFMSRRP